MNKDELTRLGITDLITIEIKPLQAADLAQVVKRYLFINVMDHSKQDILSHFETSNEFIENALKEATNKVLVHCVAGISRSASLVIAYVMKSRSMTYNEARGLVSQKRRIVDPNEGFVRQLVLYQKMGYTIDIGNLDYRRLVLDALAFEFRLISLNYYQMPGSASKAISSPFSNISASTSGSVERTSVIQVPPGHKNLPSRQNVGILFDHYYNKLHLQEVNKYPSVYDPSNVFKCTKCRSVVFYAISVIENKNPAGSEMSYDNLSAPKSDTQSKSGKSKAECPFVFIEPQPWMSKGVLERDGNLECYKCKRKLGKFDWTSGESCSCPNHKSQINLNLFKVMKKKVDMSSR